MAVVRGKPLLVSMPGMVVANDIGHDGRRWTGVGVVAVVDGKV